MNEFRSQLFSGQRRPESLLGAKKPRGAKAEVGLGSVAVPRAEIRTSDTRDGDRHRLNGERVIAVHDRRKHDVELVNLSGGGAMIAGEFEPLMWDRIELHLGEGASIGCVVRWIKDGRVGLEFVADTQIDCSPDELKGLLRDVVARSFPEVQIELAVPVLPAAPSEPEPEVEIEDEHRRAERIPLVWSGHVHFDFTSTPIVLRNISSTGALIDCEVPLPVGAEPLLDLGESGQVFASVTWCRGGQVGLAFKSPFDLSHLARSKPTIAPTWRPPVGSVFNPADEEEAINWSQLSPEELQQQLEGFMKR